MLIALSSSTRASRCCPDMCIVVDAPLFVPMFKTSDPKSVSYQPVRQWVVEGIGKFVIGGTKYKAELAKIPTVLPVLLELERKGKVVRISDAVVDAEEALVKVIEPRPDFDDPHLAALIRATGCRLICVLDPRSHKYLRASKLYKSPKARPNLYTRPKNKSLLCARNVAPCCCK